MQVAASLGFKHVRIERPTTNFRARARPPGIFTTHLDTALTLQWANASATFEPHEILGVAWDASERALRSAYRRLALAHHPDKGGDPVRFQLIVTAYEALMNRLHGNPDF